MIVIIQIVALSLILGLYLWTLRGPFVRITTTTTLTVCNVGLSTLKPGTAIKILPGPGIEKEKHVNVVKVEDNNTITIRPGDLPFHTRKTPVVNYIDEIAPYGSPDKSNPPRRTDDKPDLWPDNIDPKMGFEEFATAHLEAIRKGARVSAGRVIMVCAVRKTRRLTKDDLKIINGGAHNEK